MARRIARLRLVRARRFELRVIGVALMVAWSVAAALVLLAYRPGGPFDVVVGITMLLPIAIAAISVAWPPVARGASAVPLMVALGVGSLLVLLPSIGGVLNQILALGSQTLMPSFEAAYPWFLALVGTSLFSAFGLVRRAGPRPIGRRPSTRGIALAVGLSVASGSLFATAVIANELALQRAPTGPTSSRFGPTGRTDEPPACDGPLGTAATARVRSTLSGTVDRRSVGSVDLAGVRGGTDLRWLAYVATDQALGQFGAARVGERAWLRTPAAGWTAVSAGADVEEIGTATIDLRAIRVALTSDNRATPEDRGVEVIEGARARRCRIAVDGATFRVAFPQIVWLIGDADLSRWFGQLDYWVFLDGDVGQIAGSANGEAGKIQADALQATIEVLLTATERGRELVIYPPAP